MVNQEQIMGFIRHALTVGGGIMIARGVINEGGLNEVIGAAMTLIGFVWSYWAKIPYTTSTPTDVPSANTSE